jgi:hypothetical protein
MATFRGFERRKSAETGSADHSVVTISYWLPEELSEQAELARKLQPGDGLSRRHFHLLGPHLGSPFRCLSSRASEFHLLSHLLAVLVPQVPVGLHGQGSTVLVPRSASHRASEPADCAFDSALGLGLNDTFWAMAWECWSRR